MTNATVKMMLATAALMVASTAASAQTMKANIPFRFEAAGKMLPAGTYTVSAQDAQARFQLRNTGTGNSVMLSSSISADPESQWRRQAGGILQFACADTCELRTVWTNGASPAHKFLPGKSNNGKPVHLAVIRVSLAQGK